MKVVIRSLLLLSLVILFAGCTANNSPDTILSIEEATNSHDAQFKNTSDNTKIKIINDIFKEKKWSANKGFDVREKTPELSVTVYFNENGADVINFKAEHTVLNKVEADKLKEAASI
ncbi:MULTISPECIES: hypothetical protein [Bacillus cereus group]|uniref:Lipoprotein n=2 Tax=Bacillus cereus group TaxID=86661 RepID=A0A2B9DK42_BACCE|nr:MULTISPECIES: hypothetical protein [Bacillus cereus group]MCU5395946.1 hypothetical protein [Bacillus toyonensis]PEA63394.1 hypothetical protein COO18_28720 [Bacillus toyonensis]PEB17012.1 hypothetical protein COO08_19630 [Bacillus toyonensis]PEJ83586.1 hypothetical protein CN891_26690 [Bacillus toyonensis]PEK09322.1 hypothetical protein CN683_29005 [Bacillus toyonensis]